MKILLIGGGWIAETVYVPFLSEMTNVKHIYIYDANNISIGEKFNNYNKVKIINDENLCGLEYDAACILTPNYLHADALFALAKKGIKILVEKPICINVEQVRRLDELLNKSTSSINVSAPLRYRSDMCSIKELISSNSLGDVYHVELSWLKRKGTPGSPWFTQKKYAGGGALMDMGPHLLDLYYWLFNSRQANKWLSASSSLFFKEGDVYANWHTGGDHCKSYDVEDSSFSLLSYQDMSLILRLAWVCNIPNDYARFNIYGTKGSIEVLTSLGFSTNTLYKETQAIIITKDASNVVKSEIEERKEPFRKMLQDFINNDNCNLPDAKASLAVTSDVLNLYSSAQ